MRRLSPALLVPCLVAATSALHADTLSGARSDSLVEKAHAVHVTLRRDHAELRVTRTVRNDGAMDDEADFEVMTARDAVAVELRTQRTIDGKAHWFAGELMNAGAAAEEYRRGSGIGAHPIAPALLSWVGRGGLGLRVFPCPPKHDTTVEYTLLAPMRYEAGRYLLDLPAMGTEELAAGATLSADAGTLLVDGKKAPTRLTLDGAFTIEQRVELGTRIGGALAAVPFAADKALFSYHFDVPAPLSQVPDKARVVLIIDASHSFGEARIAAARAAAAAYLSHFVADQVQVETLVFGRHVERLGTGFQSLSAAQTTLAEAEIAPRNGSEIGLALERAGEDLAAAPAGAARRVVVFSDLVTRTGLEPERVQRSVPPGVILHIAEISSGGDSLTRYDNLPWSVLPRSTGGVLWQATASVSPDTESQRRRVFEELARPVRIDSVKLTAGGVTDLAAHTMLEEGQGVEEHRVVNKLVSHVTLSGELWSTRVERTLQPDVAYGRRRAALAVGTDLLSGLDDAALLRLAAHGRAVTPVTSYLTAEPGARPPTERPDRDELWGDEIGDSFSGGRGIGLAGIGGDQVVPVDPTDYGALLRILAEPALGPCKATKGTVALSVESTSDEIVAVSVSLDRDDAKRTKARCIADVVWAARLPEAFAPHGSKTTLARL